MKKFLSLVLALVMTMSLVTVSAGAKDFTDNSKINYAEAVDVLSEAKVIDGYADGAFNPSNTLTRGAAAKIICNLILGPTAASALVADAAPYKDVAANHPFAGYIAYCQKTGIISGYADGTFKPANSLTGYAFMKMLLGALGYDAANEGYTGANWSINVAKQAISIGLNDGLKGEFNGVKAVNREEACLYAFNTLNATMVEYDTQTIVIANGTVSTNKVSKEMANTARTETIKDDNKMQFAEKYFTNLEKELTADDFGRPSNKWTYKNTDIGTYVDYSLMVAEYVGGVSGKEVYNKLGKTAVEKYDLTTTIDGNKSADMVKDLDKNNKEDLTGTKTGVLTQVFVNDDEKEAAVVEINTYLGIAQADYSTKKDEVSFDVYALKYANKTYSMDKSDKKDNKSYVTFKVSGEDFDVSKVEEDDAYLFTVAGGEVQTCVPAETVKDTEITSFKKGSNVTAAGTKYEFSNAAYYDITVLSDYTDGTVTNLKDTTYNIYLDAYGNLIGLEEVDAVDNYVFIAGADTNSSNLATKTTDANALFLDGTSKVIEVSKTKGDGASVSDSPILNKWFTYTVDKNGVYTLNNIKDGISGNDFKDGKDKVGQFHQAAANVKIDKKNVSLKGQGDFKFVYGNTDSIYLTASTDKVVTGYEYSVISGVENVTTGVKNASIETYTYADARKDSGATKATDANTSYGVYTLFKDNGYVIAAVVVGDDAAATKNLVYSIKDSVELESYDKAEDEWTWTMKAVDAKGQEITLTEKSDSLSELKKIDTKGVWYQVKYDAKGNVVSVDTASSALKGYERIVYFTDIQKAIDAEDTVLLERGLMNSELTLKGSTLYDNTSMTRGVVVDDDTNIVFIQTNNNKETTSYETGVKALETALKNLNEVSKGVYKYEFSAIIVDGIATTVVIRDRQNDGYTGNTNPGNVSTDVTLVKFDATLRTIELKKTDKSTADDVKNAIKVALADNGYTWTEVTGASGTYTVKAVPTNSSSNATEVEFTVSFSK
ncbi:S-layer homology domain-containing protein [Dysosmobacter sp.]|uniref:S-layer homology domain-containing protein n=1 Tax=Dysosmobacter sp. TaxID=2591382 RepID=UPI003A8E3E34